MGENRIDDLAKRVQHLEDKVEMIRELIDDEKFPFMYLALESGLTMAQVNSILDLMQEVSDSITEKQNPMSRSQFEERIYQIVPTHENDYHFAQSVVRTLQRNGQFVEVYNHMKNKGMNI
jgi:hypothetical protein